MTKWMVRILIVLLLVAVGLYFFDLSLDGETVVVEPRSDASKQSLEDRAEKTGDGLLTQPSKLDTDTKAVPTEAISETDRDALEDILMEQ